MIMAKELPIALVNTWIELARNKSSDLTVKNRALYMLREAIGRPEDIKNFMLKHGIT
ncbi:MAG: hypothetical protein ACI92O_000464 [Colwellia sp.]|jgi:hypothetical protein